ncbi:splicing factor YJU2 [Megalops cyprinoides]|uniref:splicing factor YJU2 n=1 Tax=Megalops cyprinoides TaxID=118141 RepID=UPI001864CA6F|nr:splicing factor YJU2 [Megalops cyprinoides]
MSERKVLNKYYPPDFDPSKIPKLKLPKDRQYVVRLMAPFNMRCKTCGEYIYKGKKFNARKETVQNEQYMGLPIFRFYIKCTRCLAEITFKTDPENTDYAMEHGATRNFQAEKLIEEEEKKLQREREEEELNNPMKVLENRTRDSKLEMEVLENLQELKELNQRQAQVDFEGMLNRYKEYEANERKRQEEEDERETREMLDRALVKRLRDSDSDSDEERQKGRERAQRCGTDKPTDILTTDRPTDAQASAPPAGGIKRPRGESWDKSVGGLGGGALGSLVVRKKPGSSAPKPEVAAPPTKHSVQSEANDPKATSSCSAPPAVTSQTITAQNGSSLSLLGAYSDTDDSE